MITIPGQLAIKTIHGRNGDFNVGRLGRDQVEDYAARCGMDRREAETWLRPNLAYDPD